MTEAEILKWIFSNVPTLAVVIGIAKIYMKITKFAEDTQSQLNVHAEMINKLVRLHAKKHPEDAGEFIKDAK